MTNKEIRRKAWELCRVHFWRLLGVTLFISLLTSLLAAPSMGSVMQASMSGQIGIGTGSIISLLLLLLIMPILESGLIQYFANLWHGMPAGIPTLFTHARRVFRLLGISLQMVLLMYAVALPVLLITAFAAGISRIVTFILFFVMIIALIYVMLRLTPAVTAFVLSPDRTAWQSIKAAWRATKGSVWRIIRHMFVLSLPMLAANLIIMILTPATGAYASALAAMIVNIATMMISALFSIYMQFGQYGLFELLLLGDLPHFTPAEESVEPILPASENEEPDSDDSPDRP